MPFRVEDGVVSLEGHCSVEEATDLFQALLTVEAPTIDLDKAESLHTAVAQVLIASRGKLRNSPADPVLAACFASVTEG
jgi:hypothetical protein